MRVNYKCQIYTFTANVFILICLPFIIIINYIYRIYTPLYYCHIYTFSIPVYICVFCNYICDIFPLYTSILLLLRYIILYIYSYVFPYIDILYKYVFTVNVYDYIYIPDF